MNINSFAVYKDEKLLAQFFTPLFLCYVDNMVNREILVNNVMWLLAPCSAYVR